MLRIAIIIITLSLVPVLLAGDTVSICGREFELPNYWSGGRIPDSLLANRSELAPLPAELSLEGDEIYLLRPARDALLRLVETAKKDGIELTIKSGFRSVEYQEKVWHKYFDMGVPFEGIINSIAPPGYSEHHTGRAVDFHPNVADFVGTWEYWWLENNAHKFGFRQSYTEGEGIRKEPWHWYFEEIHQKVAVNDSI